MSELFPELDRLIVRRILRQGMRLKGEDAGIRDALLRLSDLKIVMVKEHVYVRCAYRDDYDFRDRQVLDCPGVVEITTEVEERYCPECGQPIGDVERKAQFIEQQVSLNSVGIEAYLGEVFQHLEVIQEVRNVGPGAYGLQLQSDQTLEVVVPGLAGVRDLSAGLFFTEPTLYVVISSINDPVKTVLEENQFVELSDLLAESAEELQERITAAATPIAGRRSLADIEVKFDSMLERHKNRRWQFFEQDFIPAFVQYVAENPELSQQYLDRLKRLHRTVFGYYYVPIGGSGVTDLRGIDKYELMTELFEGGFIGDAKCYVDAALKYESLTSVNAHLDTDPTHPRKAIVFVAGNDVSSTSWDFALRLRDRWGYWRLAIVPRYLLLELVSELEAVELLEM